MNIWTNTNFEGHWPVGVAAVIIADSAEEATELLNLELISEGLKPTAEEKYMEPLDLRRKHAKVLNNGDY